MTLGATYDRLTIVLLKIASGQANGIDVRHFISERDELLDQLQVAQLVLPLLALTLAAINGLLWQKEDEIRALRPYYTTGLTEAQRLEVVRIAFAIPMLNDARADCQRRLNQLSGEDRGPEKLHREG